MKRLVLCFDGTWNAVDDPATVTNVVKFAQAIKPTASDGTKQIVYYNSGVGSGGKLDRIFGGVFGFGLQGNVKRGLAFLSLNYEGSPTPGKTKEGLSQRPGLRRRRRGLPVRLLARRLQRTCAVGRDRRRRHPEADGLPRAGESLELLPPQAEHASRAGRGRREPRVASARQMHRRVGHRRLIRDSVGLRPRRARPRAGVVDAGISRPGVRQAHRCRPACHGGGRDAPPVQADHLDATQGRSTPRRGRRAGLVRRRPFQRRRRLRALRPVGPRSHLDDRAGWASSHHWSSTRTRSAGACGHARPARSIAPIAGGRSAGGAYVRGVLGGIGGQAQAPALAQEGSRQRGHQREGALERHRAPGFRRGPGRGIEEREVRPSRPGGRPKRPVAECTELERRIIEHCRGEAGDGFQKDPPHCNCITAKRGDSRRESAGCRR